jgi:DNA polymerase I-like protein with 3'-5' exonuclease and polymerase domains
MARFDNIGMFWADVPTGRSAADRIRVRPPVPHTGWAAPTEFPNLSAARVISFDTETFDPELEQSGPGWGRGVGHIVGYSLGAKDALGNVGQWYFPMRHEDTPEDNLDPAQCMAFAKHWLETPDIPKVGANLTYDYGWLLHEGIRVMGPLFDVQFAEALLDERARVGLDVLAQKYLGQHKQGSLLYQWCADYYGGNATDRQRKNIYRSPPSLVGPYGESDASLPLQIMEHQWPLLVKEQLLDLFHMECELIPLMVAMRMQGVPVNVPRAEELYEGFGKEVDILNVKLRELVGFGVNVNSSDDLARAFTAHGIPYSRTAATERAPDGKPSFTAGFLEGVEHPIGQMVVDIRQREKLRSVFIKSYILDNHVNSVVHGTFNQLRGEGSGARSGRFSADTPNLQNIPIRTEIGKRIRSVFADKYRPWRKYDYSQIEYRFLAHFAVDKGDGSADAVRQAYARDPNTDYHVQTQDMVKSISGLIIPRSNIKNMNFGLIYGMGEPKLARQLAVSPSKAKEMFAAYHLGAPYAKATMQACIEEAQLYGTITTFLGRKSRFDLWQPDGYGRDGIPVTYEKALVSYGNIKRAYTHKALNRRLQGSAADQMKMAMHRCYKAGIFDVTGYPSLTVHDELDFIDPGGVDEAFNEMQREMETCLKLRVPVRADYEIGDDWGSVGDPAEYKGRGSS